MSNYSVKMTGRALNDLERICEYIATSRIKPDDGLSIFGSIEERVMSLEDFPHEYRERGVGIYAKKGYGQISVGDFTIIYRVDESQKAVVIVTFRWPRGIY